VPLFARSLPLVVAISVIANAGLVRMAASAERRSELGERVSIAVIPDASHALIPEQPKAVVDALTTWIKRLP
jgi:pimeloyl-ACP methyl ester carboxylesterase